MRLVGRRRFSFLVKLLVVAVLFLFGLTYLLGSRKLQEEEWNVEEVPRNPVQKSIQHLDERDHDSEMDRKVKRIEATGSLHRDEPLQKLPNKGLLAAKSPLKKTVVHNTKQELDGQKTVVEEWKQKPPAVIGKDPLNKLQQQMLQSNSIQDLVRKSDRMPVGVGRTRDGNPWPAKMADKLANDPNKRKLLEELQNRDPGLDSIKRQIANSQLQQLDLIQPSPKFLLKSRTVITKGPYPASQKKLSTHSPHLGEFDVEAYLSPQRMLKGQGDPMRAFQFNQVASDAIPPNRWLQDARNPRCRSTPEQYQTNLPHTSIIICFHNEARSALLRTIVSVLNRSPPELIEEILLVDDSSKDPDDGRLLLAIPKVKLIRLDERDGLIRARVKGALAARGEVLTFLDSHCEATTGWLEPLLSRIKSNFTHVVSPIIDILNKDTLEYTNASPTVRGGFGSNLHFKWDPMPPEQSKKRKSLIEPIRTPAIAGGLFAVDKRWFKHIGMYDTQMDIWGAENVELSLRVWMCGGTMEIIPCSHVGHIFRSAMPYSFGPGGNYHNTVGKNIRRTVEVWLDEYRPYFYEKNAYTRDIPYGDVSARRALREQLHCKSFRWFLHNIYPQFDAPPLQDITFGQLRQRNLCLDSLGSVRAIGMQPCHGQQGPSQQWALSSEGVIKQHFPNNADRPLYLQCVTYNADGPPYLSHCSRDPKQQFELMPTGQLKYKPTGECLMWNDSTLTVAPCRDHDHSLEWNFVLPVTTAYS